MSLEFDDVPVVTGYIDDAHDQYLFIVCKITDIDGGRTKNIVCIKAAEELDRHVKIYDWVKENVTNSYVTEVLGGGWLHVALSVGLIIFTGNSCEYGEEPDRYETWRILEEAYPDFVIM